MGNSKKNKKKKEKKNSGNDGRKVSKRQMRQQERQGILPSSTPMDEEPEVEEEETVNNMEEEPGVQEEESPVIDPKQSLFDKQISNSVQENIDYMYKKYGF